MKIFAAKTVLIFTILSQLSACTTPSLPVLEGGQMQIAGNADEEGKSALEEFSKIDLIYELDPKNYGACHPSSNPGDAEPRNPVKVLTPAAKLKCALNGFYQYRYYAELPTEEKKSLKVNNVTFAYISKQADRLKALAKDFDQATAATKQNKEVYSDTVRTAIQTQFINTQVEGLGDNIKDAQEQSPFLEYQRRRRNRVQSNFLMASDAACDQYKRNLNSIFSSSNFKFGTLATVSGGLGAILTDPGTVRGLSGLSGITSGVRAEYNDAFFRNKVVELLTKAMDSARGRKREEIRRRSYQLVADYSVEDALDDAILYNAQCSLVAGLQETSESLQIVSDPGLKWLANAFGGAASNEKLTSSLFESLGKAVGTVQEIQKVTEDPNSILKSEDGGSTNTP